MLATLRLAGCVLTLSEVQRLPFKGIIFPHCASVFHTLSASGGGKQENSGVYSPDGRCGRSGLSACRDWSAGEKDCNAPG